LVEPLAGHLRVRLRHELQLTLQHDLRENGGAKLEQQNAADGAKPTVEHAAVRSNNSAMISHKPKQMTTAASARPMRQMPAMMLTMVLTAPLASHKPMARQCR
jgi:hypothetical protein